MNALQQFLQAASNAAASNISGPVDILGMGLRKLGVPVPQNALMSSQWMAEKGLTKPVPQNALSLAGETAGLLGPMVASAKAPQIARGLLAAPEDFRRYNMAAGLPGAKMVDQTKPVRVFRGAQNHDEIDATRPHWFSTDKKHAAYFGPVEQYTFAPKNSLRISLAAGDTAADPRLAKAARESLSGLADEFGDLKVGDQWVNVSDDADDVIVSAFLNKLRAGGYEADELAVNAGRLAGADSLHLRGWEGDGDVFVSLAKGVFSRGGK